MESVKRMRPTARTRLDEAGSLNAEAEALKDKARLEDLHVWKMEKEKRTKKDSKTDTDWMASWLEGNKVQNVHLGSSRKIDAEAEGPKDESEGSRVSPSN